MLNRICGSGIIGVGSDLRRKGYNVSSAFNFWKMAVLHWGKVLMPQFSCWLPNHFVHSPHEVDKPCGEVWVGHCRQPSCLCSAGLISFTVHHHNANIKYLFKVWQVSPCTYLPEAYSFNFHLPARGENSCENLLL